MIEKTEYGVLVPFEEWAEIQEQLCTASQDLEITSLKEENSRLKDVLRQLTNFLNAGDQQ